MNVQLLDLVAIYVGKKLRDVDLEARELSGKSRRLVGSSDERLGDSIERRISEPRLILYHHLEPADRPQPVHCGGRKHTDERILDGRELLIERHQNGTALQVLRLSLLERLESKEDDSGVRLRSKAADRKTREFHRVLNAGLLERDVRHPS